MRSAARAAKEASCRPRAHAEQKERTLQPQEWLFSSYINNNKKAALPWKNGLVRDFGPFFEVAARCASGLSRDGSFYAESIPQRYAGWNRREFLSRASRDRCATHSMALPHHQDTRSREESSFSFPDNR